MRSKGRAIGLGALVLILSAGTAAAQLASQKTYFTFSGRVELPGNRVLEPGKYTFKIADTAAGRDVVQVFNADETELLAMLLTVPAHRLEPFDDPIVFFKEARATAPQPIRYWYYGGNSTGHEFVYPRQQADRIARASRQPVLASDTSARETSESDARANTSAAAESADSATQAKVAVVDPVAQETTLVERQDDRATQPSQPSEPVSLSARAETGGEAGRRLPSTAGSEPLVGLAGLLLLGSYFVVGPRRPTR